MGFQDHFSKHAEEYARFRPGYPEELYEFLASLVPGAGVAWDCATGNGQAAVGLARRLRFVVATDASLPQLARARRAPNVGYVAGLADATPLRERSIDLATVALAVHWFDHSGFYDEVRRVVRPGGVLACWVYHLQRVDDKVDAVVRRLYSEALGGYWAPEIRHVEAGYRSLAFPFSEIPHQPLYVAKRWNLARLAEFMGTWSASRKYFEETGRKAVDEVRGELETAWGDPREVRDVVWDLHLRVGRV